MLSKKRIQKSFVSGLDQMLFQFDHDHPKKSLSQQAEIDKAIRVNRKRDNPDYDLDRQDLWENF